MLRVLTLATLFPNKAAPSLGVFVERQTLGLAALADVELEVVSPVGLPLWPLSLHPHYAPRARLSRQEQWKGLNVHRPRYRVWPAIGQANAAAAIARTLLPLLREIRQRFRFDVIDAEFFWPDGPAAMALSQALGVPFSIKARGADIQYWGSRPAIAEQLKAAGRAADGLLAVSLALKQRMIALGMPEKNIRLHHTGIDSDRFRPVDRVAAKKALGIDGPLLISVGALIDRKNQRLTLEALEAIPGATLILVGEGPDRGALEAIVRSRGLGERVRFYGGLLHDQLPALLAAADVMVLPSRSEGLANVWVEALACGTPIVISDVGGAREVVDRPQAGRIVAADAAAIAAAVRLILADPPDPEQVRAAIAKFSWEKNARELRDHLAGLVT
jgi:glycosyltransferase involved in cell wall biosynthesis